MDINLNKGMIIMGKTIRKFRPIWLDVDGRIQSKEDSLKCLIKYGSSFVEHHKKQIKKIKSIDRKYYNVKIADGLIFGENVLNNWGDPVGSPKGKKFYKRLNTRMNRIKNKVEIENYLRDN